MSNSIVGVQSAWGRTRPLMKMIKIGLEVAVVAVVSVKLIKL